MEERARRALAVVLLACLPALGTAVAARTATPVHGQGTCIFDHQTLWTPPGVCAPRAIHYPKKVVGHVRQAIYDSALIFGVPYAILLHIARCESGLNPRADNGTHFGLYQFAPDTFWRGAVMLRQQTGIVAHTYWRALDSAYVAGFLFAIGEAPAWTCEDMG